MRAEWVLLMAAHALCLLVVVKLTRASSVHCLAALLKVTNRTSCSLLYAIDRHHAPCTVSTPEDQAAVFVGHGHSLLRPGHSAAQGGPPSGITYYPMNFMAFPTEGGKLGFIKWTASLSPPVFCPSGYYSWRDLCRYFSTETASYDDAVIGCAALNATLVKFTDPFDQAALRASLRGDTWVGLTYQYSGFRWRGSPSFSYFENFLDGSGTTGAGLRDRCTYMDVTGGWNLSRVCDHARPFVCERSLVIDENCPRGFISYETTCHLFVSSLKGFDAAHMHCTALFSHLVAIDDAQEQAAVEALRVGEIWIGFTRLQWWAWPDGISWFEGQSTANFMPGKPGLSDRRSYLTADGDLSATAYEEQLMYYICEVDKVSTLEWSSWMPSTLDPWDLEAKSTVRLAGSPVDCDIRKYAFAKIGAPTTCIEDRLGSTYIGTQNTTVSGKTCQSWDSQTPHSHSWNFAGSNWPSLEAAENYCQTDGQHHWCYTTDPNVEREPCYIPLCPYFREYLCKTTQAGWEYVGQRAVGNNGNICDHWDAQPHYMAHLFPERSLEAASNYCRNPSFDVHGPWCYIRQGYTYEYCDIQLCTPYE